MIDILKWALLIQVLGLINLPLTVSVFQKLRSKGLHLSKPLGLLLWGFVFWWLTSLGILRNDLAGSLVALGLLALANLYFFRKIGWQKIQTIVVQNRRFLIVSEVIFLFTFVLWAVVRAANPEIINTEKFMEMAFINAILKSPGFPPHDPWLSGYGISYYYFGYVLSAMLIRVSGVAPSVGYNLVSALWFGLTALAAYGLLWDLLSAKNEREVLKKNYWLAILAPLMILIVSNWFGGLDVLHSRGFVSPEEMQGFNLPALTAEPYNYSWFPNRGGWSWWQASRVLQDTRLNGTTIEIIDEFPFFTFLLSDIHPHLLGMPFVLIAIAQALNAFRGGWDDRLLLFGKEVRINPTNALLTVITLGGLAFLNTWDFPFYLLLIAFALAWGWSMQTGWTGRRIGQLALLGLAGGVLSILAYLPFYLSFSSQAGGILPSLAFFTPGKSFWIMFGPLITAILLWLLYRQVCARRLPGSKALFLTLILFCFLFIIGWGMGWMAGRLENMNQLINSLQGSETPQELLLGSLLARLEAPGTFLSLLLLTWLALDQLLIRLPKESGVEQGELEVQTVSEGFSANSFVLMLVLLGAILVIVPEFVYLRDQFSTRMNTIFKFYFQAWILWGIAGSFAISDFFKKSVGKTNHLFAVLITALGVVALVFGIQQRQIDLLPTFGTAWLDYVVVAIPVLFLVWIGFHLIKKQVRQALGVLCLLGLAVGLIYPTIELWNKTEGFAPRDGYSLDGKQDFYLFSPDEMTAAQWLADAPLGVMAEAVADSGGSYTTYNLISTFSGMPTVLGWIGHEAQWRGGYEEIGSRQSDLRELYSTASWERAKSVIDHYNIRYIVVGELERQTYSVDVSKFESNLKKVLDTNSVDIYEVSQP